MSEWTKNKPTDPGRYETRWQVNQHSGSPVTGWIVTVKRRGRGLTVLPDPPYNISYPMSDIGNDELEWRRI
jgi:hypothetical protein